MSLTERFWVVMSSCACAQGWLTVHAQRQLEKANMARPASAIEKESRPPEQGAAALTVPALAHRCQLRCRKAHGEPLVSHLPPLPLAPSCGKGNEMMAVKGGACKCLLPAR